MADGTSPVSLHPWFPLGHNLLINLDLTFIHNAGEEIGRIIEAAAANPLQGFEIPLRTTRIAHEGLALDVKTG